MFLFALACPAGAVSRRLDPRTASFRPASGRSRRLEKIALGTALCAAWAARQIRGIAVFPLHSVPPLGRGFFPRPAACPFSLYPSASFCFRLPGGGRRFFCRQKKQREKDRQRESPLHTPSGALCGNFRVVLCKESPVSPPSAGEGAHHAIWSNFGLGGKSCVRGSGLPPRRRFAPFPKPVISSLLLRPLAGVLSS